MAYWGEAMTDHPQIQVRRLIAADASLFREIRLEALKLSPEAFGSSFEQESTRSLGQFEETLRMSDVFGAFRDGDLVGMAGYRAQAGAKQAHKGYLWGMYVRPAARGGGVGRQLVQAVLAHARERVELVQLTVVAENQTAQQLYRSLGFVAYGHEVHSLKQGGRYYDEVLMAAALDPVSKEKTMPSTESSTISSHLAVRPDWLDKRREPAIEPDLPIVDPHHHLIDRPESGRYLLPDLLKDIGEGGHNVVATVYLEWLSMYRADGPAEMRPVGEIEFANGVAAMSASGSYGKPRVCAGIVGHADLPLGARVREVLEAMIVAGGGRFRGIRFIASTDPDQAQWGATAVRPKGLLLDRQVREGFAQLAPLGLSFDAWVYHPQLADLVDLARAYPATTIVLNHVGGPIGLGRYKGKRDAVFADWSARIRELAACPNVHVKLGGLGMRMFGFDVHEGELPPSSEQLATAWRPYIETCITAFGADRAMFESNFPVDKGSYGYGVFWNACKRLAQGASAAEKASLFHGTASRVYRLGL